MIDVIGQRRPMWRGATRSDAVIAPPPRGFPSAGEWPSNGSARGLKPLPKIPRSPARWSGSASIAHSNPPPTSAQTAVTSAAVRKLWVTL